MSIDLPGQAREHEAAVAAGAAYVDVTPYICSAAACAAIVGNLLVYRDDNHLSTTFTTWLAPALAADFDAARAVSSRSAGTG